MNARQQAISSVISTLGYSTDQSTWTYDQTVTFNRALATFIVSNPDSFTSQDLINANASLGRNDSPLVDNSFVSNFSDFVTNVEDNVINAGNSVAGIGNGVLNLAALAKYIIPIAGIVVVIILLFAFKKKVA